MADLTGDLRPSRLSLESLALQVVNAFPLAGSDDDKTLVAGRSLAAPGVLIAVSTAALATSDEEPTKTKSVKGTRSTLLPSQPSVVVILSQTE